MKLECIDTWADFHSLGKQWNQLLEHSGSDTLFLRHEWLSIWWKSFRTFASPLILVARRGGDLTAAAPMIIGKSTMRGIPVRRIAFLGDSPWTPADFILNEQRQDAIERILERLMTYRWDIIDLGNIPDDSPNSRVLSRLLAQRTRPHIHRCSGRSPYLVPEEPWDDFYKKRSTKFKKVLRNKLNRISKAGSYKIVKYSDPPSIRDVMPVIYNIARKGWKERIGISISSTEENRAFYEQLTKVLSAAGWLDIWVLYLEDTPIAFEYHVRYKARIHALVADYVEHYEDFSPGSILDYHIMQHVMHQHRGEYDLGSGQNFYKMNWTDKVRTFMRISIFNDTLAGRALYLAEAKIIPSLKSIRSMFPDRKRSDDNFLEASSAKDQKGGAGK